MDLDYACAWCLPVVFYIFIPWRSPLYHFMCQKKWIYIYIGFIERGLRLKAVRSKISASGITVAIQEHAGAVGAQKLAKLALSKEPVQVTPSSWAQLWCVSGVMSSMAGRWEFPEQNGPHQKWEDHRTKRQIFYCHVWVQEATAFPLIDRGESDKYGYYMNWVAWPSKYTE